MAWIGAAIGAVGGLLSNSGGKGGGGSSSSTQPWAAAQPWLMQNLLTGQQLQQQYQQRPISARQRAALDNQYAQGDYMRGLIPSLLGQLQDQPVGFDRNNRSARPKAWDWNSLIGGLGQQSVADARDMAPAEPERRFVQQDMGYTPQQQALISAGLNPFLLGESQMVLGASGRGNGSYGAYTYGDTPAPGTQAYRDMTEFFLMGGNDPLGLAPGGLGVKRQAFNPWLMGGGGNTGASVGGSAAADGSGGGSPGAY